MREKSSYSDASCLGSYHKTTMAIKYSYKLTLHDCTGCLKAAETKLSLPDAGYEG